MIYKSMRLYAVSEIKEMANREWSEDFLEYINTAKLNIKNIVHTYSQKETPNGARAGEDIVFVYDIDNLDVEHRSQKLIMHVCDDEICCKCSSTYKDAIVTIKSATNVNATFKIYYCEECDIKYIQIDNVQSISELLNEIKTIEYSIVRIEEERHEKEI